MKIFIRWYPWSIGVNHSFKEKKHRRERPMKNKIMKGSPRKTETKIIKLAQAQQPHVHKPPQGASSDPGGFIGADEAGVP